MKDNWLTMKLLRDDALKKNWPHSKFLIEFVLTENSCAGILHMFLYKKLYTNLYMIM